MHINIYSLPGTEDEGNTIAASTVEGKPQSLIIKYERQAFSLSEGQTEHYGTITILS